ncbi:hypothetical protein PIB30_092222, partial [Stylosanthes scabra]|nr:hypothetical protein [Stylosanthes scabra]
MRVASVKMRREQEIEACGQNFESEDDDDDESKVMMLMVVLRVIKGKGYEELDDEMELMVMKRSR